MSFILTSFFLFIILKINKTDYSVRKKETEMKKTNGYKSDFSVYSKKILTHLNSDKFSEQLLEFFESIRIKDVFEVFQDLYCDVYHSSTDSISDYLRNVKVINLLDYYRKNLPKEYKYSSVGEDSEMSEFSRKFEKMVETEYLERNENYIKISSFLSKFEKTQIGLDVETLELKLVRKSTEIPTLCDPDSDTYSKLDDTTQTIKLLDLTNISTFDNMNYASIEKKFHFNLLRYIAGIIEGEEFAADLAKEIVESVAKEIASLSISSSQSSYVNLDKFPAVFFKDEDLIKFIFGLKDYYEIIHGVYKNDQNNKKLKSAMVNCFDVTKLNRDLLYKLLYSFECSGEDSLVQIKGYSGLSAKEQKNVLFSTFDDQDRIKTVPVNVLKYHLDDDEMFEVIKNKTKADLLDILSGKETDEKRNLVTVENNQKKYNILLKSEYPLYDFHFKLDEKQISELKSELIPILEQLQDVLYYNTDFFVEKFDCFPDTKEKLFKFLTGNRDYLLINIFRTIDWYPNEYLLSTSFSNIYEYSRIKSRSHFINRLSEKFGFKLNAYLYSVSEISNESDNNIFDKISKNRNLKLFKKDFGENFRIVCPDLIENFQDEYDKILKGSKLNRKSLLFSFSKEQ